MKTLKDAELAVKLWRSREQLIKDAVHAYKLTCDHPVHLNGSFKFAKCVEKLKALVKEELAAQLEGIDAELRSMGINPEAEEESAATSVAAGHPQPGTDRPWTADPWVCPGEASEAEIQW